MIEGHLPGSMEYRRIVVSLFAAGLATFALLYSTQPLLPELARQFHLTPDQAAWSVSVTTAALGLSLLVVGPLTEAVGRTPLIHSSLTVSSVIGIGTAMAPSWQLLLICRALQGAALAGLSAVALAYLKEEIHPSARARAAGLYIGGTALGGMTGRLLAGWTDQLAGWRVALGAIAALAVTCTVLVRLLLPASRNFLRGVGSLLDIVDSTRRALRDPVLLGLYTVAALLMGSFVGLYNALGFRLESPPYGLSVGMASLVFLSYAVGSVASAVAGRLADRHTHPPVVTAAVLLTALGFCATGLTPLWAVTAAVALASLGFFAAHGVASSWVAARADTAGVGSGQAASLYLFGYYAGSSMGGIVVTGRYAVTGWSGVLLTTSTMAACAALLAVLLWRAQVASSS